MRHAAAITAALLAACGSGSGAKSGDTTTLSGPNHSGKTGEGDKTDTPPDARAASKLLHLALEYVVLDPDAEPPTSRVSLILTDETGAARREIIGEYQGGCSDVSLQARGEALSPIMGLDCWWAGAGVRLRFVKRRGTLNVLRARVTEESDEASFEPVKSIEIPAGTAVRTDYDNSGPPGESEADRG